ncbi:putative oxidoreductase [Cryphonectria parasitica EP155]|uniref:Oxidoreductase n=1 Tax=Cryphonectria parasitica (strain ATCC 38755 / EP155) TaxID=660469 RepID=A0A9P4XYL5_CRYP1|nr:putative oxidoreductase [Cryphonectria parasitica EP155]KAF3763306.1 putative oxidoreductase [Cryphonectria parasitica EP155]
MLVKYQLAALALATRLASSYDYVIVGAGAAGLTVANRLSEDSSVTVLVIEAGDFDQDEDYITIPGLAGGAIGTKYDWNISYAANPELQGREVSIPQGKIVGGSTKLNRMVFDRGSKADFDAWAELGNAGWDYDGLYPYFKKQEKFTAPDADIVAEYGVEIDPSSHGYSGNIQVSYSPFFWPLTHNIVNATEELGITIPKDQASGEPIGGYFCPHDIDPVTITRSSAEEAEYDGVKNRTNLHLITGQQVTRLLIDSSNGTAKVTGVEYAASVDAERSTISVGKEAILAAGSIFTPQILQVSGIGSSSLLEEIGVSTAVDLPAVGQNFQDHVLLYTAATVATDEITSGDLTSNATFAAEALAEYELDKTGPYSTPTGDFLLFLPLTTITNDTSIAAQATTQNGTQYLPADTPAEVVAGYEKQQAVMNSRLNSTDSAIMEYIWDTGSLVLGLEHPYSRGTVRAGSNSTFDAPIATPGYLSNPIDVQVLIEAVKYTRTIRDTAAIQALLPVETSPGLNVTSDADLENFVRANSATLYHPSGSCKMGPREEGGVVDTSLKVYGTSNLRLVDASVIPLMPATHLMTVVYGIAEKASDIIKGVSP